MTQKVGIIWSPGYGAGWSTWGCAEMALDQELAKAIDTPLPYEAILHIAETNWPDQYYGGLEGCQVEWVEKGTAFSIEEYDGSESITFADSKQWSVA